MENCPVCKKDSRHTTDSHTFTTIECRACGNYKLTHQVKTLLNINKTRWPKLSAVLREYYETTNEAKLIDSYTYEELNRIGSLVKLTQRVQKFLRYIASKTEKFGQEISIDLYSDWSLTYSHDENEFDQFLLELVKQELIVYIPNGRTVISTDFGKSLFISIKLTYKAWLQAFESSESIISNRVFLAYDFQNENVDKVIQIVRKCLMEISLEPIDLKTHYPDHDQKITDKIMTEIRSARFIIADCSISQVTCENQVKECRMRNANVYFEAGFSMGLGRPVIYICEETDLKGLPFDTSQYSHIPWNIAQLENFKQRLKERILGHKLA